jgi:hypothetical protein
MSAGPDGLDHAIGRPPEGATAVNGGGEDGGDVRPDHPDLELEILDVRAAERSAAPTLRFTAEANDASGREVYTISLTALIEIEPAKRGYDEASRERLTELFGDPERWSATTQSLRWAQVDVLAPNFTDRTRFEIDVPCTFDLEVAAAKYFYGLAGGEAPLRFHFTGSVFYCGEQDRLQLVRVPWDASARFGLPVEIWRSMIDSHYPGGGWVTLERETLDRLQRMRSAAGLPSLDACVAELLDRAETAEEA